MSDDVVSCFKLIPLNSTDVSKSLDSKDSVWNFQRNQVVRTMKSHSNSIYSTALSRDGDLLATGSPYKTSMLWDLTADAVSPATTFKAHKIFVLQ